MESGVAGKVPIRMRKQSLFGGLAAGGEAMLARLSNELLEAAVDKIFTEFGGGNGGLTFENSMHWTLKNRGVGGIFSSLEEPS